MPNLFTIGMLIMNIGAGINALMTGDWRHAAYWAACAVIALAV